MMSTVENLRASKPCTSLAKALHFVGEDLFSALSPHPCSYLGVNKHFRKESLCWTHESFVTYYCSNFQNREREDTCKK